MGGDASGCEEQLRIPKKQKRSKKMKRMDEKEILGTERCSIPESADLLLVPVTSANITGGVKATRSTSTKPLWGFCCREKPRQMQQEKLRALHIFYSSWIPLLFLISLIRNGTLPSKAVQWLPYAVWQIANTACKNQEVFLVPEDSLLRPYEVWGVKKICLFFSWIHKSAKRTRVLKKIQFIIIINCNRRFTLQTCFPTTNYWM